MKEKIINFENSFNLDESIKKDEILDINQINKNDYITNIDIQNTNIEKNQLNDFDWKQYVDNYEDLQKAGIDNEKKALKHWKNWGMKEGRSYNKIDNMMINKSNKIDNSYIIESNFDSNSYKILNNDLSHLSNIELYSHYKNFGIKEKRLYYKLNDKLIDKLIDYNINIYALIFLNDNLKNLNYLEIIELYVNNKSTMIYNKNILINYNINHYRELNKDLKHYDNVKLNYHYNKNAKHENRLYYKPNYDDNNKIIGNCVIFINHICNLTGAPIFLYELILYCNKNNIFDNIVLLDTFENDTIINKYYTKFLIRPIYYYNNHHLLLSYIEYYNPIFIYSNSLNSLVYNLNKYPERITERIIFNFHEIIKNIPNHKNFNLLKNNKFLMPSLIIEKDFNDILHLKNTKIFPSFLSEEKTKEIDYLKNESIDFDINIYQNKIIFGMCGTRDNRKGYDIFINIVKNMPEHIFIWIGGEVDNKKYANFIQISHTTNPYKYMKHIDYFLCTSRSDPCPIVIIEALYLNIPCIILENNIKYNHTPEKNYFIIPNHLNNFNKIINFLKKDIILIKKNLEDNTLNKYILDNLVNPSLFKKNNNVNINVLILTLYSIRDEDYSYFKNLINYVKIIHNMEIDIILIISIDQDFNSNLNFKNMEKYLLFGIDKINTNNYEKYFNLPHDHIIFCPNKGEDIGPFLIGLKYTERYNYKYVINLHSKSNKIWRHYIFKICNYDIRNFNFDTLICGEFINEFNTNDLNYPILDNYKTLFPTNNIYKWKYNVGKVFYSKLEFFNILKDNFNEIYLLLTDINTDDIYWQKNMKNTEIFKMYYEMYKDDIFNTPIHKESHNIVLNSNIKNFIELSKKGYKGIPDLQIEHAIERYIGYLILYNKNIFKV